MLIDAHCHLNCLSSVQIEEVTASAGHEYFLIDSSINIRSSLVSLKLSKAHANIYSSLGFHPFNTGEFSADTLTHYEELLQSHKKIVAIGEIGLDYKAISDNPLPVQEEIFKTFVILAKKFNLPIIIHNRMASMKIFSLLDELLPSCEKVVFHCFSYPVDFLEEILKRKGFISFSLNVLRKKEELISSLKKCPPEFLLLETDSPYMKIKERPSSPLDIAEVYSFVSSVKGMEAKNLEATIFSNAKKLFPALGS
jgi:TatD DNase family protein